jgi:hypothetical protein
VKISVGMPGPCKCRVYTDVRCGIVQYAPKQIHLTNFRYRVERSHARHAWLGSRTFQPNSPAREVAIILQTGVHVEGTEFAPPVGSG